MGNTCKPMAVSFQCMTKSTTNKNNNNNNSLMYLGRKRCGKFYPEASLQGKEFFGNVSNR